MATANPARELRRIARRPRCYQRRAHHDRATCHWRSSRGVRLIDASQEGWGIINHDLFLSNAEVQRVIRRSIDGTTA